MVRPVQVYDLGELEEPPVRSARTKTAHSGDVGLSPALERRRVDVGAARSGGPSDALTGTLSLIVPGSGQVIRGDHAAGLFFLTSFAFLGTLGWALVETMDRLASTLDVFGYPREICVLGLVAVCLLAALLHLSSVAGASAGNRARASWPHPVASGLASAIVPGWGQVLNGDVVRAVGFLGALWTTAALWVVVSAPAVSLLGTLDLPMPDVISRVSAIEVRVTLIALLWSLAVYDAAASAARRR